MIFFHRFLNCRNIRQISLVVFENRTYSRNKVEYDIIIKDVGALINSQKPITRTTGDLPYDDFLGYEGAEVWPRVYKLFLERFFQFFNMKYLPHF